MRVVLSTLCACIGTIMLMFAAMFFADSIGYRPSLSSYPPALWWSLGGGGTALTVIGIALSVLSGKRSKYFERTRPR